MERLPLSARIGPPADQRHSPPDEEREGGDISETEMSRETCGQVSVTLPSSNTNPSGGMFIRTDSGVLQAIRSIKSPFAGFRSSRQFQLPP